MHTSKHNDLQRPTNLHVRWHARTCAHTHTHTHTRTHTHIHTNTPIHKHKHTHIGTGTGTGTGTQSLSISLARSVSLILYLSRTHTHTLTHSQTQTHAHIHNTHTHTHKHTHTHTHTHTHPHTHTHTHTHTCTHARTHRHQYIHTLSTHILTHAWHVRHHTAAANNIMRAIDVKGGKYRKTRTMSESTVCGGWGGGGCIVVSDCGEKRWEWQIPFSIRKIRSLHTNSSELTRTPCARLGIHLNLLDSAQIYTRIQDYIRTWTSTHHGSHTHTCMRHIDFEYDG